MKQRMSLRHFLSLLLACLLLGSLAVNACAEDTISFDEAETTAMSNFMQYGRYCFDGSMMYGTAFDKAGSLPSLIASEITMPGMEPIVGVYTVLDRHVNANYLTLEGNMLYYIRIDRESKEYTIARVSTAGGDVEQLTEASERLDYMMVHGGRIYFTDAENRYCSIRMDGGDEQVVLDKAVFYPYFIGEDRIVYQDDADGETLHLYSLTDGSDVRLTATRSYQPVLSGSSLYCAAIPEDDYRAHLTRIDLSSPDYPVTYAAGQMGVSFGILGDTIYGTNGCTGSLQSWETFTDTGADGISKEYLYYSAEYLVRADLLTERGTVDNLLLTSTRTGMSGSFRHVY